jgi:hypothetical protein
VADQSIISAKGDIYASIEANNSLLSAGGNLDAYDFVKATSSSILINGIVSTGGGNNVILVASTFKAGSCDFGFYGESDLIAEQGSVIDIKGDLNINCIITLDASTLIAGGKVTVLGSDYLGNSFVGRSANIDVDELKIERMM